MNYNLQLGFGKVVMDMVLSSTDTAYCTARPLYVKFELGAPGFNKQEFYFMLRVSDLICL